NDSVLKQLPARAASSLTGFVALLDGLKAAHTRAGELVEELLRRSGYAQHVAASSRDAALNERRMGNIRELVEWFRAMEKGRARAGDLGAQLALLTHADRDDGGD